MSTRYRLLLSHPGELQYDTGAHFIVYLHASCHGSRSSCEANSRREFRVRFYPAAHPTLLHRRFESTGFLAAVQGHDKNDILLFKIGHNHLLPIFRLIQHYVTLAVHRASLNTSLQHRFDFRRRHMISTFVITCWVGIIQVLVMQGSYCFHFVLKNPPPNLRWRTAQFSRFVRTLFLVVGPTANT